MILLLSFVAYGDMEDLTISRVLYTSDNVCYHTKPH